MSVLLDTNILLQKYNTKVSLDNDIVLDANLQNKPLYEDSDTKVCLINKKLVDYYFQPHYGVDRLQLKMTDISLYSTTPYKEANYISHVILNFFKGRGVSRWSQQNIKPLEHVTPQRMYDLTHRPYKDSEIINNDTFCCKYPPLTTKSHGPIIITDATANIGGNAISFHLNGMVVNAVEIDPLTCEFLKCNIGVYHGNSDRVYCSDYLLIYKKLKQDVVFLDGPWGGPSYKKENVVDLYLGETNIIDICIELMTLELASLIVLKVPFNYNLSDLTSKMPNKNILTQKIYRYPNRHSYNIVFIWLGVNPHSPLA